MIDGDAQSVGQGGQDLASGWFGGTLPKSDVGLFDAHGIGKLLLSQPSGLPKTCEVSAIIGRCGECGSCHRPQ